MPIGVRLQAFRRIIRKQLFAKSSCHNRMSLLELLFPGLSEIEGAELPSWSDSDDPWSILSKSEGGLVWQIEDRFGKDGVFIHPSAIVGDFVEIEGACYIGENAVIRHGAFLRKGSWISEGALVGHSTEVKNSLLLPGSKAPHFNYVGDSVVGFNSNLGAGVKLSNVRNDRREVVVTLKDGSRFGTGMNKIGALIGDGSQLGCNVVTNPGAIIEVNSMVNPNETVTGWF